MERSSAHAAPPVRAGGVGGKLRRLICEYMWEGSAVPPGSSVSPLALLLKLLPHTHTHTDTRLSPPDWANSVVMRGCVCGLGFPRQVGSPEAAARSDRSKRPLRAATRRFLIATVLGRFWGRFAGRVLFGVPLSRGSGACGGCSGTGKVSHSSTAYLPGARLPAAAPRGFLPRDLSVTLK